MRFVLSRVSHDFRGRVKAIVFKCLLQRPQLSVTPHVVLVSFLDDTERNKSRQEKAIHTVGYKQNRTSLCSSAWGFGDQECSQ